MSGRRAGRGPGTVIVYGGREERENVSQSFSLSQPRRLSCAFQCIRLLLLNSSPVVKLVSVVICGDDVEEQDVFRLLVQAGHLKLEVRKHLAAREGERERSSLIQFGPTRSRARGRREGEGPRRRIMVFLALVWFVQSVSPN